MYNSIFNELIWLLVTTIFFYRWHFPINFMEGIHIDMHTLISYMKFENEDDFRKYNKRLACYPTQVRKHRIQIPHPKIMLVAPEPKQIDIANQCSQSWYVIWSIFVSVGTFWKLSWLQHVSLLFFRSGRSLRFYRLQYRMVTWTTKFPW